jgi:hypothetical protein
MSINKYNAEGYYDPTAYEALSRFSRNSSILLMLVPPNILIN